MKATTYCPSLCLQRSGRSHVRIRVLPSGGCCQASMGGQGTCLPADPPRSCRKRCSSCPCSPSEHMLQVPPVRVRACGCCLGRQGRVENVAHILSLSSRSRRK